VDVNENEDDDEDEDDANVEAVPNEPFVVFTIELVDAIANTARSGKISFLIIEEAMKT
jgi:hypothetical protein